MRHNSSKRDFESQKEALMREIQSVLEQAETLYDNTVERGAEETQALRQKLLRQFEQAKGKLADFEERAADQVKYRVKQADEYINDKPYYAMGFAALVGLVVGILLNLR